MTLRDFLKKHIKPFFQFLAKIFEKKTRVPEKYDKPEKRIETKPIEENKEEVEVIQPIKKPDHKKRFLWILDNGHGKKTKGKRSPKWDDGKQLLEYEFNRDLVKRIIEQLESKGVAYCNLVPEVEIGNFLKGRIKRANNVESDLKRIFVSIHGNAATAEIDGKWTTANGIETFHYRHSSKSSKQVAHIFQRHLIEQTKWTDRGVKTAGFYVIANTEMPAILTENGFFNNKKEGRLMLKDEWRQKIADAHVNAILEIEKYGFEGLKG